MQLRCWDEFTALRCFLRNCLNYFLCQYLRNYAAATKLLCCTAFTQLRKYLFQALVAHLLRCGEILALCGFCAIAQIILSMSDHAIALLRWNCYYVVFAQLCKFFFLTIVAQLHRCGGIVVLRGFCVIEQIILSISGHAIAPLRWNCYCMVFPQLLKLLFLAINAQLRHCGEIVALHGFCAISSLWHKSRNCGLRRNFCTLCSLRN